MNQRKIRVILWVLALGIVAYWAVRLLRPADPGDVLRDAKESLARGNRAYDAKRYADAHEHFEQAVRRSKRGLDLVLDGEKRKPSPDKHEAYRKVSIDLCWTNAAGIRDTAYAKSASEGKVIAESMDTSLNQTYRSYLAIPEKERKEAVTNLRRAVQYGGEDPGLLRDALRTELLLHPISWRFVETLSKAILQADPNDQRAQYLLARIDFEQPNEAGDPTPLDRRRRNSVVESADRIDKLKQAASYPAWRVWHLEAKVRQWLIEDALSRKDAGAARIESAKLDDLLWKKTAALAKAQAGESMTTWSAWDADGMVGLFQIAFDLRMREAKKNPSDLSTVTNSIDDFLGLCRQRQADQPPKLQTAVLAPRLIDMLVRAQPIASKADRREWVQLLTRCDAWLGQASLEGRPMEALHPFALLFLLESRTDRGRGEAKVSAELSKRAEHWLQEGARLAQSAKSGHEGPFQFSLALMKLDAGATRADVSDSLGGLRSQPESSGYASLLEASLTLREGQLERSLELLNQIDKSQAAKHRFRISLLQVQAYQGLNSFNKALEVYRLIERMFADWDNLSADERISLLEAYPRREKLDADMAFAHLGIASDRYATAYRESPKKAASLDLTVHENAIESALSRLPKRSDVRLRVMQQYVIVLKGIHPAKVDSTMKAIADEAPNRLIYWATALAMSQPREDSDGRSHVRRSAQVMVEAEKAGLQPNEWILLEAIRFGWIGNEGTDRIVKRLDISKLHKDSAASLPLPFLYIAAEVIEAMESLAAWRSALELAKERYPFDPAVAYYLGKSYLPENRGRAEFHLRRAENLARCRPLGVSAEYRERWQKAAQAALESLR